MVATVFLALALTLLQAPAQPQSAPAKRPTVAPTRPAAKRESEPKQRGRELLQTAEAETAAINEAGMRGYALLQLARVYATFSRAKALELLDQAFTAAAGLPDDSKSKPRLEEQVLSAMTGMNPQHVDELMAQVPAEVRQSALQALLNYYQENKQIDRAMDLIGRIAAESNFPYGAASRLMAILPPESGAERQQLFSAALTSFRNEKAPPYATPMGDADFGEMVTKSWQGLPPSLVREAIDQILRRAEEADSGSMEVSMFGRDGSLAFNSTYEWRLFQLLPVLRRIDAAAAEDLLKKHQSLKSQFQRFPQGLENWTADQEHPAVTGVVLTARDSSEPRTGPPSPPPRIARMLAMVEQMNNVLRDVKDHPNQALTQALAIPDDSIRLRTLLLVARATQKNNSTVCRNALDKIVEQSDRVPLQEGVNLLIDAGRLYRSLGETDSVKKVVERGGGFAEKLYKTDTDSDDPNLALKAFWPSANAWTNFVRLAAEASPDAALKLVNEIPDEEIRPIVRIALAAAWLGAPSGTSVVISETKSGVRTLDGRGGEEREATKR